MTEDMDFNAGRVLTGELTMDEAADELMDLIADVASGQPSKPERLGHREFFLMYKHQDVPSLEAGCRLTAAPISQPSAAKNPRQQRRRKRNPDPPSRFQRMPACGCHMQMVNEISRELARAHINSNPHQPSITSATTIPGRARNHGKGIGLGQAASSWIRSIVAARKPEEGISSSSPARIGSIAP